MTTESLESLKKRLRTITMDGATYYLAEGDLLLDEQQLERFTPSHEPPPTPIAAQKELVGIVDGGKIVRWRPGTILSYCILDGFSSADKAKLIADMQQATQDWEDVCGVKFEHRAKADGRKKKPSDVLFSLRPFDAKGALVAAAFFPTDPPGRREVLIDPSHFTQTMFDSAGVLRHELGHVLGFRHEHILSRAPALCPKEPLNDTIQLSADYDPQSVMHYFCGGVGSRTLTITEKDRLAAQSVYGLSLAALTYRD